MATKPASSIIVAFPYVFPGFFQILPDISRPLHQQTSSSADHGHLHRAVDSWPLGTRLCTAPGTSIPGWQDQCLEPSPPDRLELSAVRGAANLGRSK